MKYTDGTDDAYDKKHGIKEGSKKDKALDKKRDVPEDDAPKKKSKKKSKGKGILKALGEKKATGNFKKIEAAKGKGAAIGALQNKLAKRRGEPVPYSFHKAEKKLGVVQS